MPILEEADMQSLQGELDIINGTGTGPSAQPVPAEPQAEAPAAAVEAAPAPEAAAPPAPAPAKPLTVEDLQKQIEDMKAGHGKALEEAGDERLAQLAMASPELYKAVYGMEPPKGMFPSKAEAAAKPGQPDDINARIARLETENAEARNWRATQERTAVAERFLDGIRGHMEKFDKVFSHPLYGDQAQRELSDAIQSGFRQNPKLDVPRLVELTAKAVEKRFGDWEESIKAKYVAGKQAVAANVKPGAGPAGAPPAGKAPKELVLGDGSTKAAFQAEVEALMAGANS